VNRQKNGLREGRRGEAYGENGGLTPGCVESKGEEGLKDKGANGKD